MWGHFVTRTIHIIYSAYRWSFLAQWPLDPVRYKAKQFIYNKCQNGNGLCIVRISRSVTLVKFPGPQDGAAKFRSFVVLWTNYNFFVSMGCFTDSKFHEIWCRGESEGHIEVERESTYWFHITPNIFLIDKLYSGLVRSLRAIMHQAILYQTCEHISYRGMEGWDETRINQRCHSHRMHACRKLLW